MSHNLLIALLQANRCLSGGLGFPCVSPVPCSPNPYIPCSYGGVGKVVQKLGWSL